MSIRNSEFITNARDDYREAGRFRKTIRRLAVAALAGGALSLGVSGIEASLHSVGSAKDALAVAVGLGDLGATTLMVDGAVSVFSALDEERERIVKQIQSEPGYGTAQERL